MLKSSLIAVALVGAATSALGQDYSANELTSRAIERRAVEAVIWGAPAVNYDLMYQQFLKLGGKPNQIVHWSRLLDWRNQTLTPNPDVIYLMAFFNTGDGPVVIEIPNTSFYRLDTRKRRRTVTLRCRPRTIRATPCCGPS